MTAPWFFKAPRPKKKRDVAFQLKDFETHTQAKERRGKLVATLKHAKTKPERKLGRKLNRCREGHRCGSASCPSCLRQFRRWFVGQAMKLFKE